MVHVHGAQAQQLAEATRGVDPASWWRSRRAPRQIRQSG
jgi:hypothetical protein